MLGSHLWRHPVSQLSTRFPVILCCSLDCCHCLHWSSLQFVSIFFSCIPFSSFFHSLKVFFPTLLVSSPSSIIQLFPLRVVHSSKKMLDELSNGVANFSDLFIHFCGPHFHCCLNMHILVSHSSYCSQRVIFWNLAVLPKVFVIILLICSGKGK